MTSSETRIDALAAGMLRDMRAHRYGRGISEAVASGDMDAIAARVWELEAWDASLREWHSQRNAHRQAQAGPLTSAAVDVLARAIADQDPAFRQELAELPGHAPRSAPRAAVCTLNATVAVLAEAMTRRNAA